MGVLLQDTDDLCSFRRYLRNFAQKKGEPGLKVRRDRTRSLFVMRIRESNWWYREEHRKRLLTVSGPTLLAANRLGFLGSCQANKTRLNILILGKLSDEG